MKLPTIRGPAFCRRAWVKFLRQQGASATEIAAALGMSELEVARLAPRPTARPARRRWPWSRSAG